MTDHDLSTLLRQYRMLQRITCALGALLLLTWLMGSAQAEKRTIEASRFIVTDGASNELALLQPCKGGAELILSGVDGTAKMAACDEGLLLALSDEKGEHHVRLSVAAGIPSFEMSGPDESSKIRLAIDKTGSHLIFFDGKKVARLEFGLDAEGSPKFVVRDDTGASRITIGIDEKDASISILDRESKLVWRAPNDTK